MGRNRIFILAFITAALMTMALACGGGGGGDAPFQESYTGSTDPAYIDTTAAVALALEAGFAGKNAIERLDNTPETGGGLPTAASLAVGAEPLTVPNGSNCFSTPQAGSHGGTLVTGFCITPGGDFLVFAEATGYATTTEYMDGYLEFLTDFESEGQYTFDSWAYADSTGQDYLLDGTIMASESGSTTTMNFNLVVIDSPGSPEQKMGYLRNYRMAITDRTTYEEVSISGRYYNGDEGYVDISTSEPLLIKEESQRIAPWDDYPYEGTLRFTGTLGNYVEIHFGYDQGDSNPGNTYNIVVEILGDDLVPNWDSGTLYWVTPD